MIRDISVGIKPILAFFPTLVSDCLRPHFFVAGSPFQGAEDTRILHKGQWDLRPTEYSRKVEGLVIRFVRNDLETFWIKDKTYAEGAEQLLARQV
jgi:hypothetical protein